MKKIFTLLTLVMAYYAPLQAQLFSDFDDFKTAATSAQAGDEIILADGTYESESMSFKTLKGTASNPIVIRAETVGGVTLTGETYFDFRQCEYITFQGFNINISESSTVFKLQTCNNIRITQNVLDGSNEMNTSATWVSVQSLWDDLVNLSHDNRIDHNVFQNKATLGNMIRIDGTNDLWVSQNDIIEFNHFKNMGPRATNEMEAIRVGWSAMSESDGYTIIRNNLFEACNGDPEIVSVKCNKVTVAHNTFRRCQGTLSLRHGNGSTVEGNFFFGEGAAGTGGVRIYGSDHKIINNYFQGLTGTGWDAPITLTKGDAEEGDGDLTAHFRIERAIIANNTLVNNDYGIEIGYDNNGKYSKPARDVVMAYNLVSGASNSLVKYITAPDNMTWHNNILHTTGSAVQGEGVSFSAAQASNLDPNLSSSGDFRAATSSSPSYTPNLSAVGSILADIEGQSRGTLTNYGADAYLSETASYKPLTANDVGTGVEISGYLYVSPASVLVSASASSASLSINTDLSWTASSQATWFSIATTSGSGNGEITITVNENTSSSSRSASLTVASSDGSSLQTIQISQEAASITEDYLSVSSSSISLAATASQAQLSIRSNLNWLVSTSDSWLSVDAASGSNNANITVSASENTSTSSRSGSITLSAGSLTEIITVSQAGVSQPGGTQKLPLLSAEASTEQSGNEAGNLIDGDFTNRWSGQGVGAYVTFDLGATYSLEYIHLGTYNSASRSASFTLQVSTDGSTFTDVLSQQETTISSDDYTLYDFADADARYVRLVGYGNTSNDWNSYTEIELFGSEISTTPYLNVSANSLRFSEEAGASSVSVDANTSWEVSSSASWLSSSLDSGAGAAQIAVSVLANTSTTSRTAQLTFQAGSFSETVLITQAGQPVVSEISQLAVSSVLASAEQSGNEAANLTDGTYSNRWSAQGVGAYVTLNLGSSYTLDHINLGIYKSDSRTATFSILLSSDGIHFVELITQENSAISTANYTTYNLGMVDAQYVRLVGFGNSSNDWNSYTELEIWGDAASKKSAAVWPQQSNSALAYPNPSSGEFYISTQGAERFTLFDLNGKVQLSRRVENDIEQISNRLAKGVYLLLLQSSTGIKKQKLIIK